MAGETDCGVGVGGFDLQVILCRLSDLLRRDAEKTTRVGPPIYIRTRAGKGDDYLSALLK